MVKIIFSKRLEEEIIDSKSYEIVYGALHSIRATLDAYSIDPEILEELLETVSSATATYYDVYIFFFYFWEDAHIYKTKGKGYSELLGILLRHRQYDVVQQLVNAFSLSLARHRIKIPQPMYEHLFMMLDIFNNRYQIIREFFITMKVLH